MEVLRKLTVFLYVKQQTGKRVGESYASQSWPRIGLVTNFDNHLNKYPVFSSDPKIRSSK